MQVSFDSTDPLADVLAVVGTVYGVTLAVAGSEAGSGSSNPAVSAEPVVAPAGRGRDVSPAQRAVAGKKETAPRGETTSPARDAGLAQRVRTWARENGVEVSGRGRLPQSTVDAYTAAQS